MRDEPAPLKFHLLSEVKPANTLVASFFFHPSHCARQRHTGSGQDALTEDQNGQLTPTLSLVSWRPLFAESSTDVSASLEDLRTLILSSTWPSA